MEPRCAPQPPQRRHGARLNHLSPNPAQKDHDNEIAIIGAGNVGTALKTGLSRTGHEVGTVGREDDAAHAAEAAELVILAVPFAEVGDVASQLGSAASGKIVIDATNALSPNGPGGRYLDHQRCRGASTDIASCTRQMLHNRNDPNGPDVLAAGVALEVLSDPERTMSLAEWLGDGST